VSAATVLDEEEQMLVNDKKVYESWETYKLEMTCTHCLFEADVQVHEAQAVGIHQGTEFLAGTFLSGRVLDSPYFTRHGRPC